MARHPVTAAAIADWCDAIGDANPCYLDEEAAAKSRHGGVVAPPATLDIWDRPGLPAQPGWRPKDKPPAEDPRSHAETAWLRGSDVPVMPRMLARCTPR